MASVAPSRNEKSRQLTPGACEVDVRANQKLTQVCARLRVLRSLRWICKLGNPAQANNTQHSINSLNGASALHPDKSADIICS